MRDLLDMSRNEIRIWSPAASSNAALKLPDCFRKRCSVEMLKETPVVAGMPHAGRHVALKPITAARVNQVLEELSPCLVAEAHVERLRS